MRKSNPVYDLCLIYKTVYERERKKAYHIVGRDFKEAKTLLELNSDLDMKLVESHAIEYFKGGNDFWSHKEFPAYGLFMQFNEYQPPPPPKRIKRYCNFCFTEHFTDEPHARVQLARPETIKETKQAIVKLIESAKYEPKEHLPHRGSQKVHEQNESSS